MELIEIKGFFFLQELHLGAPWHNIVYCSGPSKFGYTPWLPAWSLTRRSWRWDDTGSAGASPKSRRTRPWPSTPRTSRPARARTGTDPWSQETGLQRPSGRSRNFSLTSDPLVRSRFRPSPARASRRSPTSCCTLRGGSAFCAAPGSSTRRSTCWGPAWSCSDCVAPPVHGPAAHGRRLASIGDNMGAVLSYEKGRATDCMGSSPAGPRGCLLPAGLRDQRYAESDRNPTDRDSRAADRGELGTGLVQHGDSLRLREQVRLPNRLRAGDRPHAPPPLPTLTRCGRPPRGRPKRAQPPPSGRTDHLTHRQAILRSQRVSQLFRRRRLPRPRRQRQRLPSPGRHCRPANQAVIKAPRQDRQGPG